MEYFLIYLGVGLFVAISALIHKKFKKENIFVAFVVSIAAWPLVILVAPESILGWCSKNVSGGDSYDKKDYLKEKATEFLKYKNVDVLTNERKRIKRIAKYGYEEVCAFSNAENLKDIIDKLWDIGLHPNLYHSYLKSLHYLDESYDPEFEPRFSLKEPEWYVGFSNEFVKSILKIDRKKQGRILEAIGAITAAPVEVRGDTIKPLTGDLNGLWRCRIGDDRLVYFPDIQERRLVLIIFSSRGEVYGNIPDTSVLTSRSIGRS